ncbi:MAG: hypothetical protein CM1200mP9_02060 [Gammaproteobacteria bacterium]|nr:MAG: hypothetical protein CM1200mP9_02060 [Gammaproteobacteria bacterium]
MSDVVVREVRWRSPEHVAPTRRMKGGRDAELYTLLPYRVIVVGAVQS